MKNFYVEALGIIGGCNLVNCNLFLKKYVKY